MREYTEKIEKQLLSPYAQCVIDSQGRQVPEPPCDLRTDFQRDRDRIIYCKSFRRLKHKTQVFLSPEGDHYRTRLTHTLEVSQIARTMARALRLNEDLTEAIAMGHDLGHTPFGHAGERILNEISAIGFQHNKQSRRVVEVLENDGKGLNLTFEVRDGIENHTSQTRAVTLEGRLVALSDRIAYINHDIDDAIRAGLLTDEDLPFRSNLLLGTSHSQRINTLIHDVVKNSLDQPEIHMSEDIYSVMDELRNFMFTNIYHVDSGAKKEERKAEKVIESLYNYYCEDEHSLPPMIQEEVKRFGREQAICDYIAGMTDRYALAEFSRLFIPAAWDRI